MLAGGAPADLAGLGPSSRSGVEGLTTSAAWEFIFLKSKNVKSSSFETITTKSYILYHVCRIHNCPLMFI